jgi:hypothetical protein
MARRIEDDADGRVRMQRNALEMTQQQLGDALGLTFQQGRAGSSSGFSGIGGRSKRLARDAGRLPADADRFRVPRKTGPAELGDLSV